MTPVSPRLSQTAMDIIVLAALKSLEGLYNPDRMTHADAIRFLGQVIESLQAQLEDMERADEHGTHRA